MTSFAAPPAAETVRTRPRPASVQPTKTTVLPSRDQDGNSSNSASSPVTRRRGAPPPAIGFTQSLPRVSKTTDLPSGDTLAQRGMVVWKRSGETSICGCVASITTRVSSTWKGITADVPSAAFTRRILPPAQNTTAPLSGVQAMFG